MGIQFDQPGCIYLSFMSLKYNKRHNCAYQDEDIGEKHIYCSKCNACLHYINIPSSYLGSFQGQIQFILKTKRSHI